MYVVTAATGHLGTLVVEGLLEEVPAEQVAVVVRNPEKAAAMAARGVEVRVADYGEPATLQGAFKRGERVLLISGSDVGRRVPQHSAVIDAAKDAGATLLAYTSGPDADFELAAEHQATERYLRDSGLPYTVLRNGWYNENQTENLDQVVAAGSLLTSAGEGGIASASRADYAAAAVAVLTGDDHENRTYELNGDTAITFTEYAAEVSRQLGREIPVREVSAEAHREILLGNGLPEPVADILVDIDRATRLGVFESRGDDLTKLIGRPTTPIADSIAEAVKRLGE